MRFLTRGLCRGSVVKQVCCGFSSEPYSMVSDMGVEGFGAWRWMLYFGVWWLGLEMSSVYPGSPVSPPK